MKKKEFFINSVAVRMVDIDGSTNIPTVLFYGPGGNLRIGSSALASAKSRNEINEDFKIDLGNIDPISTVSKRIFATASGEKKSAIGLAGDFIYKIVQNCSQWLENNDIAGDASILLAEPLAMQAGLVEYDWLSNYRQNLRRLLVGKQILGKHFENVDFLPEPFAVFQYYRYGLNHPIVAERTKQHALVIDFGAYVST